MPGGYQWPSDQVKGFVEEPHSAFCSQCQGQTVLDLTTVESSENRKATLDIVRKGPSHLRSYTAQRSLLDIGDEPKPCSGVIHPPRRHKMISLLDIGEAAKSPGRCMNRYWTFYHFK